MSGEALAVLGCHGAGDACQNGIVSLLGISSTAVAHWLCVQFYLLHVREHPEMKKKLSFRVLEIKKNIMGNFGFDTKVWNANRSSKPSSKARAHQSALAHIWQAWCTVNQK